MLEPASQGAPFARQFGSEVSSASTGRVRPSSGLQRRDGPSVFRQVASIAELERDPRLAGKLSAPEGSAPPPGVQLRTDPNGVRFLTVNIHMGVPGHDSLAPSNENIDALRDVARYVNSVDPDVVIVQELRDRPFKEGQAGLPNPTSVLFHLIRASDMAFTPAKQSDPDHSNEQYYGTGIYTRNGFTIDRAVNVALPNPDPTLEDRSVGVAAIQPPDDTRQPFTVLSTHLHNTRMEEGIATHPVEDQVLRDGQVAAMGKVAAGLRQEGAITYRDALTGKKLRAEGFPGERLLAGGDLNQYQAETDAVLNDWGLEHVGDLLVGSRGSEKRTRGVALQAAFTAEFGLGGPPHRIDHVYSSGFPVVDAVAASVPAVEFRGTVRDNHGVLIGGTDHCGVVVDLSGR